MAKVPVKRIWLRRVEGRTEDLGQRTVTSFHDADEQLARWAQTAPKNSVHKTDFQVEWEDGQTYNGTYELSQEDATKLNILGSTIQHYLAFHAGIFCPQKMSREDYENYLEQSGEGEGSEKRAGALAFLQNYEM
jgi:hypothetical protein